MRAVNFRTKIGESYFWQDVIKFSFQTMFCVIFVTLSVYYFTAIRTTSLGPARLESHFSELQISRPTSEFYFILFSSIVIHTYLISDATTDISHESTPITINSTCSDKASNRGMHQNVISFSFYGEPDNKRDYFNVKTCFFLPCLITYFK
jgi:hypothetical protein